MKNLYIAIDPGKAGFISIITQDGERSFFAMPTHKVETVETLANGKPKMKTEFYEKGLVLLAAEIAKRYPDTKRYGCIEEVIGRQGWSAQNNFNFGYVAGMQKMMLMLLGCKIMMVRPQKWQSYMYQGFSKVMVKSSTGKTMVHDTKATSKIVAQSIAPSVDFRKTEKSKNLDDNKTDAFLMCHYMKQIIEQ